jgi:ribosome-binding factor A
MSTCEERLPVCQTELSRPHLAASLVSAANCLNYAGSEKPIMKRQTKKGPSQRQLRAGELLRHALSEIFRTEDIEDAELAGEIITVAEVRMSPDLKHATVFASTLGGKNNDGIARALNRHHRFLRGELARRIELKYVPDLMFRGDSAVEAAERIEQLLRSPDVARDLK